MLLKIKTSKACTRTEGRNSEYYDFYICYTFFLGLCNYSHKFRKMFCSSWGEQCPSTANFCHQRGQQLNLSQVSYRAASSVEKEKL